MTSFLPRKRSTTELLRQNDVGAVGVEPTGPLRATLLQRAPTPYGTTHPI